MSLKLNSGVFKPVDRSEPKLKPSFEVISIDDPEITSPIQNKEVSTTVTNPHPDWLPDFDHSFRNVLISSPARGLNIDCVSTQREGGKQKRFFVAKWLKDYKSEITNGFFFSVGLQRKRSARKNPAHLKNVMSRDKSRKK